MASALTERIAALAASGEARGRTPSPLPAARLRALSRPDGAPLGALGEWLAFDATWLPLVERRGRAIAFAVDADVPAGVRAALPGLGLRRDTPLVALPEAASQDLWLALDARRGDPVLAWEKDELFVRHETFVDAILAEFAPRPATKAALPKKVGRLPRLEPAAIEALDAEALARRAVGLREPGNAKLLADLPGIEALVRALRDARRFDDALDVADLQAKARRGQPALGMLELVLDVAADSADRGRCATALAYFTRVVQRDPSDLYGAGGAIRAALRAAEVASTVDVVLDLAEKTILFVGGIFTTLPADDPRLAPLRARPRLAPLWAEWDARKRPKKARK